MKPKWEDQIYRLVSRSPVGILGRCTVAASPRIILAYHGVQSHHPLCVDPIVFSEHMHYILRHFDIVPVKAIIAKDRSSRPTISVTFDDAYANLIVNALPVLLEHRIAATIYTPSRFLGKRNEWDAGKPQLLIPIMSPGEIREVHSSGIEIGSHTQSHVRMRGLGIEDKRREIADSKCELEDLVGAPVTSFAYPHGGISDYDEEAVLSVEEAGYETAVTTRFGRYNSFSNRLELRRIIVRPSDTLPHFISKLSGAYDWISRKEEIAHRFRWLLRNG